MDNILHLLEKNDIKKQIKNVVQPIGRMIYNEIYVYVWFICVYLVLLLVAVSVNIYLTARTMSLVLYSINERGRYHENK